MEKLFHHVCGLEKTAEGIVPMRFTPRQLGALAAQRDFFGTAGRCAAGVTLEMTTEAPVLRFVYTADCVYQTGSGFDVEENGCVTGSVVPAAGEAPFAGEFVWERRTAGRARIRVFLPHGMRLVLRDVDFGAWEPVPVTGDRFLFLGDSLTQTAYAPHPSAAFSALLADSLGADWLNQGVGSLYYCASTLDAAAMPDARYILIEFGPNDLVMHGPRNEAVFEDGKVRYLHADELDGILANAQAYFERVRELWPGARDIRVMTVPWNMQHATAEEAAREGGAEYRRRITAMAQAMGFGVIDGTVLVPHAAEMHMTDGVHYSDAGNYAAARTLERLYGVRGGK